jgi:hypothetical protein
MNQTELLQCLDRKVTELSTLIKVRIVPLAEKHDSQLFGNGRGLVVRTDRLEQDFARINGWTKLIITTIFTAIVGAIITLFVSCSTPPKPTAPIIDSALTSLENRTPAPATAEEGISLQSELLKLRSKLHIAENKAATADSAVGVLERVSWLVFLIAIASYFISGTRAAIGWGLAGLGLVFAPTIVGEFWNDMRPFVTWAAPIAAILLTVTYGGTALRRYLDRRKAKLQAENIRATVEVDHHKYSEKARAVLLGQAALLDHVNTKHYDPHIVALPKVVHQ